MRTTPNDVNVNTKTMAAAAPIAGRIAGSVISRNTRRGDAPSVAAAASRSRGSVDSTAPTVRTTTARLNSTWAATIAATPRSIDGRQDGQHGGADHHGRQHEHGDEGAVEEPPAGEVEAGDHVRRSEPDDDRQRRRDERLPQREPHDVPRDGVAERVGEAPTG